MPTNPFTPVFPAGVDPAVVIPTNGAVIDANDRRRIDTQILALQSNVISTNGFTTVGLADANATLSTAQWPAVGVIFTGTLSATRTLTIPTQTGVAYRRHVLNETAQSLILSPSSGGSPGTVTAGTTTWVVFDGTNVKIETAGGGGSVSPTGVIDATSTFPIPQYGLLTPIANGNLVWATTSALAATGQGVVALVPTAVAASGTVNITPLTPGTTIGVGLTSGASADAVISGGLVARAGTVTSNSVVYSNQSDTSTGIGKIDGAGNFHPGSSSGQSTASPLSFNPHHPVFGASGNSSTDDTAALLKVDALAVAAGRHVEMTASPAGEYYVNPTTYAVTGTGSSTGAGGGYIQLSVSTPTGTPFGAVGNVINCRVVNVGGTIEANCNLFNQYWPLTVISTGTTTVLQYAPQGYYFQNYQNAWTSGGTVTPAVTLNALWKPLPGAVFKIAYTAVLFFNQFPIIPSNQYAFDCGLSAITDSTGGPVIFNGQTDGISPAWFGAKCNGAYNDGPAIQQAVLSIPNASPARINLQAGTYDLLYGQTGSVPCYGIWTFQSGMGFQGNGRKMTTINGSSTVLFMSSSVPYMTPWQGVPYFGAPCFANGTDASWYSDGDFYVGFSTSMDLAPNWVDAENNLAGHVRYWPGQMAETVYKPQPFGDLWTPTTCKFSPVAGYTSAQALQQNCRVQPRTPNGHWYIQTVSSTSTFTGSTEPTWPTTGGSVADGTCTWQDMGLMSAATTSWQNGPMVASSGGVREDLADSNTAYGLFQNANGTVTYQVTTAVGGTYAGAVAVYSITTTAVLTPNHWHHIIGRFSGTNLYLYVYDVTAGTYVTGPSGAFFGVSGGPTTILAPVSTSTGDHIRQRAHELQSVGYSTKNSWMLSPYNNWPNIIRGRFDFVRVTEADLAASYYSAAPITSRPTTKPSTTVLYIGFNTNRFGGMVQSANDDNAGSVSAAGTVFFRNYEYNAYSAFQFVRGLTTFGSIWFNQSSQGDLDDITVNGILGFSGNSYLHKCGTAYINSVYAPWATVSYYASACSFSKLYMQGGYYPIFAQNGIYIGEGYCNTAYEYGIVLVGGPGENDFFSIGSNGPFGLSNEAQGAIYSIKAACLAQNVITAYLAFTIDTQGLASGASCTALDVYAGQRIKADISTKILQASIPYLVTISSPPRFPVEVTYADVVLPPSGGAAAITNMPQWVNDLSYTPTAYPGTNNDLNVGGGSTIVVAPSTGGGLTGGPIVGINGYTSARVKSDITSANGLPFWLRHNDSSVAAAHRIFNPTGADALVYSARLAFDQTLGSNRSYLGDVTTTPVVTGIYPPYDFGGGGRTIYLQIALPSGASSLSGTIDGNSVGTVTAVTTVGGNAFVGVSFVCPASTTYPSVGGGANSVPGTLTYTSSGVTTTVSFNFYFLPAASSVALWWMAVHPGNTKSGGNISAYFDVSGSSHAGAAGSTVPTYVAQAGIAQAHGNFGAGATMANSAATATAPFLVMNVDQVLAPGSGAFQALAEVTVGGTSMKAGYSGTNFYVEQGSGGYWTGNSPLGSGSGTPLVYSVLTFNGSSSEARSYVTGTAVAFANTQAGNLSGGLQICDAANTAANNHFETIVAAVSANWTTTQHNNAYATFKAQYGLV